MIEFSPFVKRIIEDYQRYAGIVNEAENISSLFFILMSKEYNRKLRLHSILQNLSGAGKSTLADAAVKPFKQVCPNDVIEISRFTGAALQRYENFDMKILYHSQAFGDEPQTVLPLLSEGNLGLMVSEKEEGSNKFVTKIYQLQGMPSFLSTTVIQLDPQFSRRVVLRTADESAEQTRKILKAQALAFKELDVRTINPFPFVSKVISKVKDFRVHSVLDQVIIPYGDSLEAKLPDNLEMRSNFPKFLKLIASVAIVKSVCYRGLFEIKDAPQPPLKPYKKIVAIATAEDFSDAFRMGGKGFFQPLSAAEQNVLDYLSRQISQNKLDLEDYAKVRMRDLLQGLKLSRPYLYQITKSLSDKGLIEKEDSQEGGHKVSEFKFVKQALEIADLDAGESTPEKWLEGKSYQKLPADDAFGEAGE